MLPSKRTLFEAALLGSGRTSICAITAIKSRVHGLPHDVKTLPVIPLDGLSDEVTEATTAITLNFSYRFQTSMNIDDLGVAAALSFSGKICNVFVPWSAIGMVHEVATGESAVWPVTLEPSTDTKPAPFKLRAV